MSLAGAAGIAAGFLAATCAVLRLWHGAQRQTGALRHAYRWFALAAALSCASLIVGQATSLPVGAGAVMLSFADLPALLVLPVMALGLAALASAGGGVAEPVAPRSRRGLATVAAHLADGFVLASAFFIVFWVTVFGPAFTSSAEGAQNFAAELVHPLADLVFLGAMFGAAVAAGRLGVLPYLALAAITASDSLAVGARVAGAHPGVASVLAGLVALGLLALTPVGWRAEAPPDRWVGGPRGVATAVAAAVAAAAAMLVVIQAIVSGKAPRPVVLGVLGITVLALAARVLGLVRRVNLWARVWQESGTRFRQLADRTSDVVLLCDLEGVIRYASQAVADYGYTPDSLRGMALADLLHPEDKAGGMRAVRRAVTGVGSRSGKYPCRVRAADGTWRHVESTVSRHRDPGRSDQLLVTARDVSAQVALRRQVTHLTFHDGLTGLPNRSYIEQRSHDVLGAAGEAGLPGGPGGAGVIILDLDGFTAVNESAGLNAGDLLLAQIARRLRLTVSPQDTVARWGGDEFAVLIEDAGSAAEIAEIAERLARSVASQPVQVGERDMTLTSSVGVAFGDGSPASHVWRNAEVAMSQAKESGGDRVEVYSAALAGRARSAPVPGSPAPGSPAPGVPVSGSPAPGASASESQVPGASLSGTPAPVAPAPGTPAPGGETVAVPPGADSAAL